MSKEYSRTATNDKCVSVTMYQEIWQNIEFDYHKPSQFLMSSAAVPETCLNIENHSVISE